MDSLTGKLLIATPDMVDLNFGKSVVFLIQHASQGASGVILNQPLPTSVSAVWDEISDAECDCELAVNCGGPVDGPLLALHQKPDASEREIIPQVHLSMHRESLHSIVMQSDFEFRIFSGYSGWGAGQLDAEIENGGWLILDAKADHIFGEQETLWRKVCEHVGHDVLKPHLNRVRNLDPKLN
jgi:putative transcriptional regulator